MHSKEERLNAVKTAARARILNQYGLKDLFRTHNIDPAQPGFTNGAKTFGKHVAEFGRDFVFGSPLTMKDQLKNSYKETGNAAKATGNYVKNFYTSPNSPTWIKAISLGLPALGLGRIALNGSPETRVGDLSHALSGLATAPFTSRLGLAGIPLQGAIQGAARYVGSKFDKKPVPAPTPDNIDYNVRRHLARVLKARKTLNHPFDPSSDETSDPLNFTVDPKELAP